jgi:hypothetical protein
MSPALGRTILLSLLMFISSTLFCQSATCELGKMPRFEEFPSEPTPNRTVPPKLTSKRDRLFRTTIRATVEKGANFAGRYAVAGWGCGTGCNEFVIVDVQTGTIYHPDFKYVVTHDTSQEFAIDPHWWCLPDVILYRIDSELMIIEGCLAGRQCGRTYFQMRSTGLRQIAYDPDRLPDGRIAPF